MKKKIFACISLIACLGCGGKQTLLENEVASLKGELRDCQYAVKDLEQKQRELRLDAVPKVAKRPPSPRYVAPWHRSFSALVPRVREVMGEYEFDVGFRNGALVIFVPTSSLFPVGGKKLTPKGVETVDALLKILKRERNRDLGVTVRSPELSKRGVGKRGELSTEASVRFNRALSIYRAMEITNAVEAGGINPLSVVTAAYAVDPDEGNPAADGVVEFTLHPVGDEIPDFPEPGKGSEKNTQSQEETDGSDFDSLD